MKLTLVLTIVFQSVLPGTSFVSEASESNITIEEAGTETSTETAGTEVGTGTGTEAGTGTGRKLFETYPELRQKLWKGQLWNHSYYVETIGSVSEENIRRYIEHQSKSY